MTIIIYEDVFLRRSYPNLNCPFHITRMYLSSVCGLLMPSSSRQAYFALRAFNVEIANIKDASRSMGRSRAKADNDDEFLTDDSSLASRLRMQWWKDGIAEVYENQNDQTMVDETTSLSDNPILRSLTSSRKQNPVMRSLSQAIHNHHLTHRFLRSIIEAREEDLDVIQYEKCTDVAQYGEDTVSSVLYLTLETVGVSYVYGTEFNCCVLLLKQVYHEYRRLEMTRLIRLHLTLVSVLV